MPHQPDREIQARLGDLLTRRVTIFMQREAADVFSYKYRKDLPFSRGRVPLFGIESMACSLDPRSRPIRMNFVSDIDNLCTQLRSEEIGRQAFVDACARLACQAVGCSRAGLWVFAQAPSGLILRCLGMYDARTGRMEQVEDRVQQNSDVYFAALRTEGNVIADDAASHPATQDFFETGLRQRGVVSLLSAAFSLNGELFGAFTCSQVGETMHWTRRQLNTLSRIGSRATLALASVSPNQLSTFFGPIQ